VVSPVMQLFVKIFLDYLLLLLSLLFFICLHTYDFFSFIVVLLDVLNCDTLVFY